MGMVVIGAVFVDVKGYPQTQFIPGGRNVGRIERVHGGVGRNVAEDIANIELRPTFVSLVDRDASGREVIDKLNNHKVDTRYIRQTEEGMGTWLAVFNSEGDVVASVSKRPDLRPILNILDEHGDQIFKDADSIVVELDIDKEVIKKIFYYAEKYNKEVYALVSNMSIAVKRRDFLRKTSCFVCNQQEAGMLFSEDYGNCNTKEMSCILKQKIQSAKISRMVVTMGGQGAVYAELDGEYGICPSIPVEVVDTTGAGDSFFAGTAIGLTYGKTLKESCMIGAKLAASVICTSESVCPRFLPSEIGIEC